MRAAAVQVQSADYLKPLFKSLRSRVRLSFSFPDLHGGSTSNRALAILYQNLPADVLGRLSEIVHHMQSRQYQKANDSYLRLSIGTAAWPIGVTMVGYVNILDSKALICEGGRLTLPRRLLPPVFTSVPLERRSRQIRSPTFSTTKSVGSTSRASSGEFRIVSMHRSLCVAH